MISEQDYENMAVIGQVADIVHAFKESSNYLKRLKERRSARSQGLAIDDRALQDLEFSLIRGQDVIRSQYERNYRRLGQPFVTGDREAVDGLKGILIDVQRDVVSTLKTAYQHDRHIEFLQLQDISDESQDRAVMTLMQLHQRCLMENNYADIAAGNPYGRQPVTSQEQRGRVSHQRSPAWKELESSISTKSQGEFGSAMNNDRYTGYSGCGPVRNLPTPSSAAFQDEAHFIHQSGSRSNMVHGPSKPMVLDMRQKRSGWPSLPLDCAPGPPPSMPLPPLPVTYHEQKREQKRAQYETERQSQSSRDSNAPARTYVNRTLSEIGQFSWINLDASSPGSEFAESRLGTPVDSSHIDDRFQSVHPGPRGNVRSSDFMDLPPPTRVPSRQLPAIVGLHSMPSHLNSIDSAMSGLNDRVSALSGLSSSDRSSTASAATFASYNSASSSVSTVSSQSSVPSNTSWLACPPPKRQPTSSYNPIPPTPSSSSSSNPTRSRSTARVPEAIYESPDQDESQTTLRPNTSCSAPDSNIHQYRQQQVPQPQHIPAMPSSSHILQRLESSRGSIRSQQSSSSGTPTIQTTRSAPPSTSAGPSPIRTIPPVITDASNSKLYLPRENNKFAGLCKSAWRAQIGDTNKAYSVAVRPGGVTRTVDYMKCKTCEFSGRVALSPDAKGKMVKGPDRKVILSSGAGIAYRWEFLFKSHLCLKNGTKSEDAEYGCMFCCADGWGTLVFKGIAAFSAHIAEHRPGVAGVSSCCRVPEGPVCDRMEVLVGRVMGSEERFEVALPAVGVAAVMGR